MKRSAGFTLIELVIVIVILGILGAVAAPKFLNLQGDAYGANLQAVKSSMESTATLINAKAILAGKDKGASDTGVDELDANESGTGEEMAIVYGYPAASAIVSTLEIKVNDADAEYVVTTDDTADPNDDTADPKFVLISPKARATGGDDNNEALASCAVKYENATKDKRPNITITKTGC